MQWRSSAREYESNSAVRGPRRSEIRKPIAHAAKASADQDRLNLSVDVVGKFQMPGEQAKSVSQEAPQLILVLLSNIPTIFATLISW